MGNAVSKVPKRMRWRVGRLLAPEARGGGGVTFICVSGKFWSNNINAVAALACASYFSRLLALCGFGGGLTCVGIDLCELWWILGGLASRGTGTNAHKYE